METLICSSSHTKEWRKSQPWYTTGKKNECEKFQKSHIERITGASIQNTYERIFMEDSSIRERLHPMKNPDGFEYTEDFDGKQSFGNVVFYYNLKFVCDSGGSQTRTLREVYLFIKHQIAHIKNNDVKSLYFINILDGDGCFNAKKHFNYILSTINSPYIFCGDMLEFNIWFNSLKAPLSKKSQLGQFYTTNSEYILNELRVPCLNTSSTVVEPFAGTGELVEYTRKNFGPASIETYDIDPKYPGVVKRDTLKNPPELSGKFVITNPPYLARNKNSDKSVYEMYGENDLYKCFIRILVKNTCTGGILILPLNFWCSTRKSDRNLRKLFISTYDILRVNVFEEQVFSDTSYSVCAFSFIKKVSENRAIPFYIFPSGRMIDIYLYTPECMIGGDVYHCPDNLVHSVKRWVLGDDIDNPNTNISLCALDDGTSTGKRICLYLSDTPYRGKHTDRTKATMIINPQISKEKQEWLVSAFNHYIEEQRQKYHSLFLCNYRESKEYARKRISFDLVYTIIQRLLQE